MTFFSLLFLKLLFLSFFFSFSFSIFVELISLLFWVTFTELSLTLFFSFFVLLSFISLKFFLFSLVSSSFNILVGSRTTVELYLNFRLNLELFLFAFSDSFAFAEKKLSISLNLFPASVLITLFLKLFWKLTENLISLFFPIFKLYSLLFMTSYFIISFKKKFDFSVLILFISKKNLNIPLFLSTF